MSPSGFTPLQFAAACCKKFLPKMHVAAASLQKFLMRCILQHTKTIWREGNSPEKWTEAKSFRPAAICSAFSQKILDEIHIAAASHKKFWPKCILQCILSKVLDALHFAERSLKKFGAAALLQQLRHKNSSSYAPCSTLPQGGLAVHGYAGAICKMV